MSLSKYIARLQRMDYLIALKATGPPDDFACKLQLSRSTLFETLQEMKSMGVDIRYSNTRESYYYADERRIIIRIERINEKR
ncbi:MAG TPA: hypothetical protein VMV74_08160 [Bacteroidales bacterium]|nr:hypothetical protein [Bacteroidales bacterium]